MRPSFPSPTSRREAAWRQRLLRLLWQNGLCRGQRRGRRAADVAAAVSAGSVGACVSFPEAKEGESPIYSSYNGRGGEARRRGAAELLALGVVVAEGVSVLV